MKTRLLLISVIVAAISVSLLASDQYYLSWQDKKLKESDWIQNCVPVGSDGIIPAIGLFNHTHSFDLQTCSWGSTEDGTPGFLESLYISFIETHILDLQQLISQKEFQPHHDAEFQFLLPYAYAVCAATILPEPCFDAFMGSTEPMTEKSIMETFGRHIEVRYPDWKISDRNWDNFDERSRLPAIICTEFVVNGVTEYRMAKWVDATKISSFENHRNDWLCNKWLPPIDDGIALKWDKDLYSSDDIAQIQVIDKDMNLDPTIIDSFDIHVFSDTDHTGISLTVTETEPDAGYFYGNVFLTATDESSGTRLLVEDAIYGKHKENTGFSKIINESKPQHPISDISTENSNECWYQEDDGSLTPCKIDPYGFQWVVMMFLVVFWPWIILGIVITIIFIVWRKRK